MSHTLHWNVAFAVAVTGILSIPIKSFSGSAELTDPEYVAGEFLLAEGLSTNVAIPDGHGGDLIKYSGPVASEKLFGFLNLPISTNDSADVWITQDAVPEAATAAVITPTPIEAAPASTSTGAPMTEVTATPNDDGTSSAQLGNPATDPPAAPAE